MNDFGLGRFTSTDPILFSDARVQDPQRANLYIYGRNNPLKFVDADGEDINEPENLSERDQKRYDDWKAKFLSTEGGRKKWDQYVNDKNFTLNITMLDRGSESKNASAETKEFKFDEQGNLIAATIELGNNLGSGGSQDSERYPVSATINSENSGYDAHTKAAGKIAHEFGHVDDFRSRGKVFFEQRQIEEKLEQIHKTQSIREYINGAAATALRNEYQKQFGQTVDAVNLQRDHSAERNAIPIIRQLLGKDISSRSDKAMKVLEKQPK